MATATITGVHVCDGGGHVVLRLTVGGNSFDFSYDADEVRLAISAEERKAAVLAIARFHCGGMTRAEAAIELQPPGISVSTT